jgi:hypothetical protein
MKQAKIIHLNNNRGPNSTPFEPRIDFVAIDIKGNNRVRN